MDMAVKYLMKPDGDAQVGTSIRMVEDMHVAPIKAGLTLMLKCHMTKN